MSNQTTKDKLLKNCLRFEPDARRAYNDGVPIDDVIKRFDLKYHSGDKYIEVFEKQNRLEERINSWELELDTATAKLILYNTDIITKDGLRKAILNSELLPRSFRGFSDHRFKACCELCEIDPKPILRRLSSEKVRRKANAEEERVKKKVDNAVKLIESLGYAVTVQKKQD